MIRKHLQNKVKERPRNLCHKIRKPIQKRKLDQPEQNFCAAILQMFCMGRNYQVTQHSKAIYSQEWLRAKHTTHYYKKEFFCGEWASIGTVIAPQAPF